jgi:hypothetical protein
MAMAFLLPSCVPREVMPFRKEDAVFVVNATNLQRCKIPRPDLLPGIAGQESSFEAVAPTAAARSS